MIPFVRTWYRIQIVQATTVVLVFVLSEKFGDSYLSVCIEVNMQSLSQMVGSAVILTLLCIHVAILQGTN